MQEIPAETRGLKGLGCGLGMSLHIPPLGLHTCSPPPAGEVSFHLRQWSGADHSGSQTATLQLHHPRTAPVQSLCQRLQSTAGTAWEVARVKERLHLGHTVCELSTRLPTGAAREAVLGGLRPVLVTWRSRPQRAALCAVSTLRKKETHHHCLQIMSPRQQ